MLHRLSLAAACLTILAVPTATGAAIAPASPPSASDTVDVAHVMEAFHQAVVGRDGRRLLSLFLPNSLWLNILGDDRLAKARRTDPSAQRVRLGSAQAFADLLAKPGGRMNPVHTNVRVLSDGTIATVYFDFTFLVDDKPQNRGSETWQLARTNEGWRIASIAYSSN